MKTKQTALEWLILEINEHNGFIFTMHYDELFKQAKAMEKEQMIEFANKVIYNAECSFTGRAYLEKDINEIYNESYGN
jgi:hypothetical protein